MRLLVFFGMQWIVKEINRNTVNRIFGFYYLQYLNKFILQWNSVWTICSCRQNMITIHRMLSSLFTMSNVLALFFIRLWSECRGSSDNRKKKHLFNEFSMIRMTIATTAINICNAQIHRTNMCVSQRPV